MGAYSQADNAQRVAKKLRDAGLEHVFTLAPAADQPLQRVRIGLRRNAELRITVLSRAQELADDAAVFDDPNRVNTDLDAQLAIGAADIRRAAKANLVMANRVVLVTQPAGGGRGAGRGRGQE